MEFFKKWNPSFEIFNEWIKNKKMAKLGKQIADYNANNINLLQNKGAAISLFEKSL